MVSSRTGKSRVKRKRKRKRHVIRPPGPMWLRRSAGMAGVLYLCAILLGSAGCSIPRDVLSRPLLYFTQVACLFPHALVYSIEYRVSAFSCQEQRFKELDYRVYFPLHPDDKENRFQRLGHFYRKNRIAMKALEDHLTRRHNHHVARGQNPDDGINGPIGGIMLMSLRIPLPEPGARFERYTRKPLVEIPREWRKHWYVTPLSRRRARCGESQ